MTYGYTKLFGSILTSTIWDENPATCKLWITMLALADRNGEIQASVPGLAHQARITLEECRDGLDRLLGPDHDSRTPDHEGRRIVQIPGGWVILNHSKYRDLMSADEVREKARLRKQRQREREQPVTPSVTHRRDMSRMSRQSESESESLGGVDFSDCSDTAKCPTKNTPPLESVQTSLPDPDQTPPGLHKLQYAGILLEEIGLTRTRGNLEPVAEAIVLAGRKHDLELHAAYDLVLARARAAIKEGETINRFWFEDGKFLKTTATLEAPELTVSDQSALQMISSGTPDCDILNLCAISPARLAELHRGMQQ